jgi:hypothetical protein
MTTGRSGLSAIPSADLERLLVHLGRTAPQTPTSRGLLAAARLGHLWDALNAVASDGPPNVGVLVLVVRAVLDERQADLEATVDLVWTGGEAKMAYSRPTATVVRELFESAERHLLIAGYSFDHGASIMAPLHARMKQSGLAVDVYLHVERARRAAKVHEHVERAVATFFAANWPFGVPHPMIYIAPRTIDPGSTASLHAKCVVADERVAVVGSANFTDRGQSRNIEVGARIEDASFARAVVAQFRAATHAGVFEPFDASRGE